MSTPKEQSSEKKHMPKKGDSLVVGPVEKTPNSGPSNLRLIEKEPEEIKSEPDDDYGMMEEEEDPKVENKRKRHY